MNFTDKMELKDKKIEKLNQQIADLQAENDKLRGDLELERNDKSEAFQQAKNMIAELEGLRATYEGLIEQTNTLREAYISECSKLEDFRKKATKKNKETLKIIRKKGGK